MKKLKVLSVFVICCLIVSVSANAVEFRKDYNNYEITAVDNTNLAKDVEKVWNLTYEGSENPITVTKRKIADGTAYVVNSKHFEVCYMSSSKGFGARTVKKAWSSVPLQINTVILNPNELNRQKTIVPSEVDDEMALGLIASYLPGLLNEQYKHLLN